MMLSQGSELFFTNGTTLYKIGCVLTVTPLSDPLSGVDQTPLGNEVKFSAPGMITPSAFSATVHYDGDDVAQKALLSAYDNRTTLKWCVLLPETTSQPSLSGGNIVAPASRTSLKFSGWLTDRPLQIAVGQIISMTIPVSRTTEATLTPAV